MYYTDDSEASFYGKFRNYAISKGDTLQSVAQKLDTDAMELRRYHNMYCLDQDIIEADFKRYSKFLILPPEKMEITQDSAEKKLRKVSLGNNYKLPFLPRGICKDYSVVYNFEVGDQIDTLEMGVRVKWLKTDENNYHLFEIQKSVNLFIDNNEPDRIMDELAVKAVEALYPLKIVVDEFGQWIDIYNYTEIKKRWGKIKDEILDYYEGEVVEDYIKEIEYMLEDSDRLFLSLRSDYFLRTFFNGMHVEYTAEYGFQNDLLFPLEKETESVFSVQHKMDSNLDDAGFIKIEQKAHYIDSGFGFLYGYDPLKVNYSAVYFLNSDNYIVEKMNLECNIWNDKPIKKTIVIELL